MQDFPLKMNGAPAGALQYAAYSDAAPSDAAESLELAEWLFGRGQFPKLDDVDMQLLGAEVSSYFPGFVIGFLICLRWGGSPGRRCRLLCCWGRGRLLLPNFLIRCKASCMSFVRGRNGLWVQSETLTVSILISPLCGLRCNCVDGGRGGGEGNAGLDLVILL